MGDFRSPGQGIRKEEGIAAMLWRKKDTPGLRSRRESIAII